MNQHLYKKCMLDNAELMLHHSKSLVEDMNCKSDNLHAKFILKYISNNSTVSGLISNRITNLSLQLSEQKQSHGIKTSNIGKLF
jgi:D-alanyl-D-alanine carboxypeptidase